ncbi:MAG: nicotinamide-nucleotide amidohydrolase family protein [Puniceicoccales bacterium]|jgi:PncC family amidohydrolase|nr:nicotinamide-nucleotide amidohydrolase family protein [Puniceicoccales bacterium]
MDAGAIRSIDGSPDDSHYVFQASEGNVHSLISLAVDILRRRRQSISFAESVTGGMLADLWVAEPGVSDVFPGAVVAYGDLAKETFLAIPKVYLQNFGAVSREVALAMAEEVRQRLATDFSIALTGIAGPGGGSSAWPIGTIWVAMRTPTRKILQKVFFPDYAGQRNLIREKACYAACKIFIQVLFEEEMPSREALPFHPAAFA